MRPEAGQTASTVDQVREIGRSSSLDSSTLSVRQKVLVGLEAFISLCGLGGGLYLVANPLSAMSVRYLDGTWFHSWRWPGVALIVFVGLCPLMVIAATLQGRKIAIVGHVCVGAGLIAWIVLEAAWIVVSPGLQIAVAIIGVVILALGIREWAVSRQSRQRDERR